MFDANQDGLADLVVLIPYEKIKVLIQTPTTPSTRKTSCPPAAPARQPWLSAADVDGDGKPELLMAQKNFLRAVVLQHGKPERHQRQAGLDLPRQRSNQRRLRQLRASSAPRRCATGRNAVPSLFLLDSEQKALTLCERDAAGVWQVVRNLPLPVTDFSRLAARRPGRDQRQQPGFPRPQRRRHHGPARRGLGTGRIGRLRNAHSRRASDRCHRRRLEQRRAQRPGFPGNRPELSGFGQLFAAHKLVPGNRWQVFEERTFRSRRNDDTNRARPWWPTSPATAKTI